MSANVDPTHRNSAPKSPIFGAIAKANRNGVQWDGLALEEYDVPFSKYRLFLFLGELTEKIQHFFTIFLRFGTERNKIINIISMFLFFHRIIPIPITYIEIEY